MKNGIAKRITLLACVVTILFVSCDAFVKFDNDTGAAEHATYYRITLIAEGASIQNDSANIRKGGNCSLLYDSSHTPKKDGCTFIGWYDAAVGGKEVHINETVTAEVPRTLYAHWLNVEGAKRVGGEVFFVDEANGVNYTFYTADGSLIGTNTTSISLLKKAAWYTSTGSSSTDRYYVAYPYHLKDTECFWCPSDGSWNTLLLENNHTESGMGKGRSNSLMMLSKWVYTTTDKYRVPGLWGNLKKFNSGEIGNIDLLSDWYIGTKEEYLKISNTSTLYGELVSGCAIWCSDETDSSHARYLGTSGGIGDALSYGLKYGDAYMAPIRSF